MCRYSIDSYRLTSGVCDCRDARCPSNARGSETQLIPGIPVTCLARPHTAPVRPARVLLYPSRSHYSPNCGPQACQL